MCGICGIVDFEREIDLERVISMRDAMVHRGPDDLGLWTDANVALGHRRLSIIDLSPAGHQPMSDGAGLIWVTYNGEIYNFKALRTELIEHHYKFVSDSDTEVLVHGYHHWGIEGLVKRLNGIFSFAIWDCRTEKLTIARDHLGVKPLYYVEQDSSLIFASEIKSLIAGGHAFRLNSDAVEEQLVFRYVAGERTLVQGIRRLLPGHYATFDRNGLNVKQYWSPLDAYFEASEGQAYTADEQIDELLRESLGMQLIGDVPIGVLCSGGIDSSILTALASTHIERLNTFCVSFHADRYDDAPFARIVSERYGTRHHELSVESDDYFAQLMDVVLANDEPLAHNHEGQLYHLSKIAKPRVTVLISGEGADELFCGYKRYELVNYARWLGTLVGRSMSGLLRRVPNAQASRRTTKLLTFGGFSESEAILYNSASVFREHLERLSFSWSGSFPYRAQVVERIAGSGVTGMAAAMIYDQMVFLCSLLDRNDKMTMQASIECRVPFLDYRLVAAANMLPMNSRRRYGVGKRVLRERLGHLLPGALLKRSKMGFSAPFANWCRTSPLIRGLVDQIANGELVKSGLIEAQAVKHIVGCHESGIEDLSGILWTLLTFELWYTAMSQLATLNTDRLAVCIDA